MDLTFGHSSPLLPLLPRRRRPSSRALEVPACPVEHREQLARASRRSRPSPQTLKPKKSRSNSLPTSASSSLLLCSPIRRPESASRGHLCALRKADTKSEARTRACREHRTKREKREKRLSSLFCVSFLSPPVSRSKEKAAAPREHT